MSPPVAGEFFTTSTTWEAPPLHYLILLRIKSAVNCTLTFSALPVTLSAQSVIEQ